MTAVISLARLASLVLALPVLGSAVAAIEPSTACSPSRQSAAEPAPEATCYALVRAGRAHTFRVYAKARATNVPVVVVLHGADMSGASMELLTRRGFNRIADREGAVIVYPDDVKDLDFLRALPRALAVKFAVNPLQIFVTGIADGGMMSYRLACEAADIYAAAAPVAANLSGQAAKRCKPSRPISIAVINGTDDPVVPWDKGATIKRWRTLDHCDALEASETVDAVSDDRTLVIPQTARCLDGTAVQLYEVRGGGHTWPGGAPDAGGADLGRTSREIDATEVIWSFLIQYRLGAIGAETKL